MFLIVAVILIKGTMVEGSECKIWWW